MTIKTLSIFFCGALAALSLTTAHASSKVLTQFPTTDGQVGVITLDAAHDRLYIAGAFTHVGGEPRAGVAALGLSTGAVLPWNPGVEGNPVRAIAVSPETGRVFLGGDFTKVGGLSRTRLAAVEEDGTTVTDWNPIANTPVSALAVEGNTLYVGGFFTAIGSSPVNRLASLDATTGNLLPGFSPEPDGEVTAIIPSGLVVYVGGHFTTIGGGERTGVAALNSLDGSQVADFNASLRAGEVYEMVRRSGTLYFIGGFGEVNGSCATARRR